MGSKMFPFITHTHNILEYCAYNCTYCWAKRYQLADPSLLEKRLSKKFPDGSFVFLNDCGEMYHPDISANSIARCYEWMSEQPDVKFLTCTKNPLRILEMEDYYSVEKERTIQTPDNMVIGCTLESDLVYPNLSHAPIQTRRYRDLKLLNTPKDRYNLFVSIEPILKFTDMFALMIKYLYPWGVAVGYDNYNHRLPEPSLEQTKELIERIRSYGITVYEKTLRKAWWEESFGEAFQRKGSLLAELG